MHQLEDDFARRTLVSPADHFSIDLTTRESTPTRERCAAAEHFGKEVFVSRRNDRDSAARIDFLDWRRIFGQLYGNFIRATRPNVAPGCRRLCPRDEGRPSNEEGNDASDRHCSCSTHHGGVINVATAPASNDGADGWLAWLSTC
jgi:hypothetical protein